MKLDLRIRTGSPAADGYWTPRLAYRRAVEVVGEQGPKALWFKVLGETVYRRLAVYAFPIDKSLPEPGDVQAELGLLDDVAEYLELLPQADAAEIHARLRDGHRCLVARSDGRIVHVRWSSTESVWVDVLGCMFHLAPGHELGYGTFTHPDFRRYGLAGAVRAEMIRRLRNEGITCSLAIVEPENMPSVRFNAKFGSRRIGVIGAAGAGSARYCFCRTNRGETVPGTMCGAKRKR
jgi:GNAT superfamily N-acetyltransferase